MRRRSSSSTPSRRSQGQPPGAHPSPVPAAHDSPRVRLLQLACLSRLAIVLYAIAADALIPDHDAEGALKLPEAPSLPFFLRAFTRWDAAHFLSIAQHGGYPTLPSHAFFPFYPALLRGLASLLSLSPTPSLAALVAAALLVTHASFVIAVLALYELTRRVVALDGGLQAGARATRGAMQQRQQEGERLAYLAALLYICSPASIFYTTTYSETLFSALSFSGLLLALDTRRLPRFALGCFLLAGASATRSNGLLNCLPLALGPATLGPLLSLLQNSKRRVKKGVEWGPWVRELVVRGLGCLLVLAPYVGLQYYGWRKFCTSTTSPTEATGDLAWCHQGGRPFPFPSLYAHIQSRYWGVGFLRYWQWKQLPNFLLAAPVLLLTAQGLSRYFASVLSRPGPMRVDALLGYHLQWAVLGGFTLLVAHVQIATRLLGAACPALYWSLAARLLEEEKRSRDKKATTAPRAWLSFRGAMVAYCVVYNLLGPLLHCNFLPWT